MELTYTKVGDYYIPDLVLDEQPDKHFLEENWASGEAPWKIWSDAQKISGRTPSCHL